MYSWRRPAIVIKVSLVLCATLLSLLIGEIIIRTFFPVMYHEAAEWIPDGHITGRFKPEQTYETGPGHNPLLVNRNETHTVTINKFGFRGPDHSLEPEQNTIRIVVFGGSAAFSYHDQESETWTSLLATCLSKGMNRQFELVNLALPGFDTNTSKINYLVNGRLFHPHAIIVYHTWNDLKKLRLFEGDISRLMFSGAAASKVRMRNFLARFHTVRLLRKAYYLYKMKDKETHYRSPIPEEVDDSSMPNEQAFYWFKKNFEDFAQFALNDGVLPIFLSQGSLVDRNVLQDEDSRKHVSNEYVQMSLPVLVSSWEKATALIKEVAASKAAVFVDVYHNMPHSLEYFEDHVHLSPKGNRFLSQFACEQLIRNSSFQESVRSSE